MLHPLLSKIWEREKVPEDWKKGHLVKLPKKLDLSSCGNWRGIILLSIPGKVLTRIMLERLKTTLHKRLRDAQAGFRQDRSCTDRIATMRIIIEQSLEWQAPLCDAPLRRPTEVYYHHPATLRRCHLSGHL